MNQEQWFITTDEMRKKVICINGIWFAKTESVEDVLQASQEARGLNFPRLMTIDAWELMSPKNQSLKGILKQLSVGGKVNLGYKEVTRVSKFLVSEQAIDISVNPAN